MATYRHTPVVLRNTWYRVDTASGSNTPTTVTELNGTSIGNFFGNSGSTVHLNTPQDQAAFLSTAGTLYLKPLDRTGAVDGGGTIITSTGADTTIPPAARGGGGEFGPPTAQTLSGNGAVTIDASTGGWQIVNLAANATSSTITGAATGQVITLSWIQDATGSRTYAWPSNCKFAGGAAPTASTTASYRDNVTFRYDGTNWIEIARSVAIR